MATAKKATAPVKGRTSGGPTVAKTPPAAKPVVRPVAKTQAPGAQPVAVRTATRPKAEKPKKAKLVRDSFTIPKTEYLVLDDLKQRAAKLGQPAKKSELLRAGLKALAAMGDESFKAALRAVPAVKTGRPAKAA